MSQTLKKASCPICRKHEATADYKPFCSKRCADVDLSRWFNGGYAIPTDDSVSDGEVSPDIQEN